MLSTNLLFALVCLSSISLWFFVKPIVPIAISYIFLFASFYEGYISYQSLIFVLLFTFFCLVYEKKTSLFIKNFSFIVLLCFMYILVAEDFPYSTEIPIFTGVRFSPISKPFWLDINVEKSVCAIIFAAILIKKSDKLSDWKKVFKDLLLPLAVILAIIIPTGLITGYIKFDFKLPSGSFYFLSINLFLVCVAEEVFFRGFLQRKIFEFLSKYFKAKVSAPVLANVFVAVLFGYAHLYSGYLFAIFAFIAGLGYGYAYQKSGKIEAAILAHFGLNLIHFIFFTYPAFQSLP
ncbi:CPBP family intramembrane glutamic endopeptidase [Fluviispira vulneris]|uniref:CPBP family intramembrane glutamic endopeptidase n=1 Tax=Fluviispira vulneris TaxID=2763012 RepID=UPI0016460448|nr:CPBP family intramembrane glutamic endopeptidase [Fluviispira vulneris]